MPYKDPAAAKAYDRAYRQAHKERAAERQRAWGQANKEHVRVVKLRYRHGDRAEQWAAQDGQCYLCGDPLPDGNGNQTVMDHDHSCCPGKKSCAACRRGLACSSCNAAIGYARDDPARLRRIAGNLEMAKASVAARRSGLLTLF